MSNPLSMFHDDDGQWSMTRVVAAVFTGTYCVVLVRSAATAHEMGWPFCALGVMILLAVPVQAMFRYLQEWFTSSPGQKVLAMLFAKVTSMGGPTTTSTTAHTESTTHTDAEGKG